jgi:hypothetical protein
VIGNARQAVDRVQAVQLERLDDELEPVDGFLRLLRRDRGGSGSGDAGFGDGTHGFSFGIGAGTPGKGAAAVHIQW